MALFAGIAYLGHPFLLAKAADFLIKQDALKPADVIVALGGEETERVEYAVALYKDGWAKKDRIIMTGGPVVWKYTAAGLMKEYAEYLGVGSRSVLLAEKSRSTEADAKYVKEILVGHGYKSIILVTSPYHSKRASIIFAKVLGSDVKIINAPVEKSWFKVHEWWKRDRDRDVALSEYSKFIRLLLFGVNKTAPVNSL